MAALMGKEAKYIRADTLGSIVGGAKVQPMNLVKPWSVSLLVPFRDTNCATMYLLHCLPCGSIHLAQNADNPQSSSGLAAHFALSPSRSGTYQATPSIHSARYAALRPLFKARQSLISFYAKEGYLHPSNWTLTPTPTILGQAESELDLPHLSSANVDLPELRPGDMVYGHSLLPFKLAKSGSGIGSGSGSSDFVRVDPLTASAQVEVMAQKEAYENGLPPPRVVVEGTVAIEESGSKDGLGSNGGRSAMGY